MMQKLYNFKIYKQIHFLEKKNIIHFVNVETDSRLRYAKQRIG